MVYKNTKAAFFLFVVAFFFPSTEVQCFTGSTEWATTLTFCFLSLGAINQSATTIFSNLCSVRATRKIEVAIWASEDEICINCFRFFLFVWFFFSWSCSISNKNIAGETNKTKKRSSYFLGSFGNTFMKQCATFTDYYTSVRSKLKQLFTGLGLFVLRKSFVQGLDIRNKNSNRIFLSTDLPTVK